MYGNEIAAGTGGTLAMTGALATGSIILAVVAAAMLIGGFTLLMVRRHRLRGQRP